MAERRMMSKKVIHGDHFMDLPATTKVLYFYLMIEADDDGFVNSPKRIQRMIGATDDDASLLIAKKFILSFESGIIVVKHWKMHNYIRSDRYKETSHTEELSTLSLKDNGVYTMDTVGIPSGSIGKDRLGEVRLGKDTPKRFNFKQELLNKGVDGDLVEDYLLVRKSKKASNTKTAFAKLSSNIEKSGMSFNDAIKISTERSWAGFDVQWLEDKKPFHNGKEPQKGSIAWRMQQDQEVIDVSA